MSKKRKREVDVELVQVYEGLADDAESVRLQAAYNLVSKIFKPGVTSDEQIRTILTRLFRGICSGRKSARLGFSVALTEFLSQLPLAGESSPDTELSAAAVVDILEAQTVPEGGTSGQDERDHYFGRVFGIDALLKSGILVKTSDLNLWRRVLDLLIGVAKKKPWLRQECGWTLLNCIVSSDGKLPEAFAAEIIDKLAAHKLIRTPEGLAIWLTISRLYPHAKLPQVWKHDDPLAKKDINVLADLLKDARAQSDQADTDQGAQGSARWSANLHFAWDVVLGEMFRDGASAQNGKEPTRKGKRAPFDLFWKTVVDEGLFSPSSSTERKAWGFGVWRKVFETGPQNLLPHTFTPQATHCLVNSLKSPERLLQKHALRLSQTFSTRLDPADAGAPGQGLTGACVRALLQAVSYGDFDQITKSKTMQNLMDVKDERVLGATALTLSSLLSEPLHAEDDRSLLARQKCLIGLQFKVAAASLRHAEKASVSKEKGGARVARTIFSQWITGVCGLESTEAQHSTDRSSNANLLAGARDFMRERLTLGFEQALKLGPVGCEVLRDTVLEIHSMEEDGIPMATSFEDDVLDIVQGAWEQLSSLSTSFQASQPSGKAKADSTKKDISDSSSTFSDGLCLLYCLILFQIYTGESDAVEVLKDLLESHQRMIASTKGKPKPSPDVDAAEAIVEIILSFASRPSKFLRRISIQVFEAFAPSMTSSGLEALCRILTTPENVQGQQEMFQGEDNMDIEEADGASDEKEDALDSDVEVESVSAADGEATDDEGSADDSDNEEDEELAAFDAALAAALGTRPLDQNDVAGASSDSDSASDADMNDDEMMELDSKLAEVFRARNEQQAKNKKKESKEAKENVVNFKNRVLDLVESYLKVQPQKPLTLDLIVPLLTLARTTQTKQLADHACNILEKFNARCKGPNVPELTAGSQVSHALDILGSIHDEAGMDSSNAHSITASLMSIAVVKTLVKQDPANIAAVVEMYASTRMKQLTKKQCRILPGFFTDWNNWCTQAKAKLSK